MLVLDLGFEAVVAPFDNVDTEDVERIPPMWKQAIDDALERARLSRIELLERLEDLEGQIEELEATADDPGAKKKERREAEERLGQAR